MWDIGNRLRERREAEKIEIGQVAEYEGISKAYVSQLETGKNKPNWDLLARLARRYKTSADYILGLTDDHRPAPNNSLPEGAQEIIECMAEMSPRGRAELLTICRSILAVDKNWQELEIASKIAASLAGEDKLKAVQVKYSVLTAQLGDREAALRQVLSDIVADRVAREKNQNLDE